MNSEDYGDFLPKFIRLLMILNLFYRSYETIQTGRRIHMTNQCTLGVLTPTLATHYNDITERSNVWNHDTLLFIQQLVNPNINENIKSPEYWSVVKWSHHRTVDPPKKGQ